jgi:hypothetical protein
MKKYIIYGIAVLVVFFAGFYSGKAYEKSKHKEKVSQSNEILKTHEKEIEIINTELDSAAINRFRKNYGSGSR